MKQCVKFPEDKFLAVRTCLVAICMGNRPAANLLSILLFRYNLRMENKDDAENQNAVKASKGESPDQDTSVRIFRTQAQLVEDMCGEITEKTLHDTAVPMLQLLGFLDLEEHMIANCYILHVELVQQALSLYIPGKKEQPQLENFLIEHMQLEKFLITSDELENFLINRKIFQSGLEKVLIQNRKFSNQQRGRRLSADVPLRGKRRLPKKREEDNKKNVEEEREDVSANASTLHAPASYQNLPIPVTYAEALAYLAPHGPHEGLDAVQVVKLAQKLWTEAHESDDLSEKDGEEDTKPRPIVVGGQFKQVVPPSQQTTPATEPAAPRIPPTASSGSSPQCEPDPDVIDLLLHPDWRRNQSEPQEKPKRTRKKPAEVQLTLHEQEIKEWYEELRGVEVSFSKRNVAALQALGKRTMSKDDFLNVTAILDDDKWFEAHKVGVDLYWINYHWDNRIIYLQRKKPRLADKKAAGPPDFSKAELVDEQWNIYKIPGDDTEYTYWPLQGGKLMPVAEADLLGYNGGAGLYNVTQYKERATKWPI